MMYQVNIKKIKMKKSHHLHLICIKLNLISNNLKLIKFLILILQITLIINNLNKCSNK